MGRFAFTVRGLATPVSLSVAWFLLLLVSGGNACSGNTCAECISWSADCAWCADVNFTSLRSPQERCDTPPVLKEKKCTNIQDPLSAEDVTLRRDDTVTDGRDGTGTDAIQLQPQKMYIKIRPKGKGFKFDATFRAARNFPVDLYFLFDVSATMKESVSELGVLADQMARAIRNISTNYRLGYGIFQDKVILPFTSTHPVKLANPYPSSGVQQFAAAFAFDHLLSMTSNLISFRTAVNESLTKITGNLDRPEGGFDAIMQAIVCQEMGWRDNSRQLIIFASDARMHYAGDGKLAGLITPNDEQCHLTLDGSNAMSEKQDYPSVGQISAALDRSKKYVIFAVKQNIQTEYEHITNRMARSFYSALSKDNNIVDIVESTYREMTKGVKLDQETTSDNIQVTITPDCEHKEGSSCTNLKIAQEVRFNVNIRAKSCPANPADRVQTVTIAPSDFRRDKLVVTVEVLCDCGCQLPEGGKLEPSDECTSGNGTLECGVCRCFPGRAGSTCECKQDDDSFLDTTPCKKGTNSSTAPECSGTGECECGVCKCKPGYSGKYCQCNSKVCPVSRLSDLVCWGNGECDCEQCRCFANYTGVACQCSTSDEVCTPKKTSDSEEGQRVCSGHGTCVCDNQLLTQKCDCYHGYRGQYCEECFLNCTSATCDSEEFQKQCAKCGLHPEDPACHDVSCPTVVQVVELDEGAQPIIKPLENSDCYIVYAAQRNGSQDTNNATAGLCTGLLIQVKSSLECPMPPNLWIVVGGIVGGVVAVGLLLFLQWKIITMLLDKMEYAHFARELKTHKWAKQVNPLYKGASTTYYNPIVDRSPSKADDL